LWYLADLNLFIYNGMLGWNSERLLAGRPGFDSQKEQDIFLFSTVQTGSGAHPASYPVVNWGSSPEGKATRG
jgi:hypothetical protein